MVAAVTEQVANAGHRREPFGRIRGAEYIERHGWAESTETGIAQSRLRSISGHIGDEVLIAVRADAKQQSIRRILALIDYHGVKSVLSEHYSQIVKRIRLTPEASAREEPAPWDKLKRFLGMAP